MTLSEFRQYLEAYRTAANDEAVALKDSYIALDRLHALYENLGSEERSMADQVFSEWAQSEDENLRFDALAMIDDFKIKSASFALQNLLQHLVVSPAPGAPYELEKVKRILADL